MIRSLVRWVYRLLFAAVVLIVVVVLARDVFLRTWVAYRLGAITGLETRLHGLRSGLFDGTLTLTDLRVSNSPAFGGGLLLHAPELHLRIDGKALSRRELRLDLARLNVAEFSVVRAADGRTNVFEAARTIEERANLLDALFVAPPGLKPTGIETFDLTLDRVRFANLGFPPFERELRIGLTNEILRNVDSVSDFNPLIVRILLRGLGSGLGDLFPSRAPAPKREPEP